LDPKQGIHLLIKIQGLFMIAHSKIFSTKYSSLKKLPQKGSNALTVLTYEVYALSDTTLQTNKVHVEKINLYG